MRAAVITIDAFISILIFLSLVVFLSSVWNSLVSEFFEGEQDIMNNRAQQTLTLIMKKTGTNHLLDAGKIGQFVNRSNVNYTSTKHEFGVEDLDYKFIVSDLNGFILYQTNTTPSGSLTTVSRRYGYMSQPVKLELWVWK